MKPSEDGMSSIFPPPVTRNSQAIAALEEKLNREHPDTRFVILDPDRIGFATRLPAMPADPGIFQMLEYARLSQYIDGKAGVDIGADAKKIVLGYYQMGEAGSLRKELPDGRKVCVVSRIDPDRNAQNHMQGYFDFEGFGRYAVDLDVDTFDLHDVVSRHEVAHCIESRYAAEARQKKLTLAGKKSVTDEDLYDYAHVSHKQEVFADLMAAMEEPASNLRDTIYAIGTLRTAASLSQGRRNSSKDLENIDSINAICSGAATYSRNALKALGDIAKEKGSDYFSSLTYGQKMDISYELVEKHSLDLPEFAVMCGYHRVGKPFFEFLDNEGKTDEASRAAAGYIRQYDNLARKTIQEILTETEREPPYFRTFLPSESVGLVRTVAVMRAKPAAERDIFENHFIRRHDEFLAEATAEISRRLDAAGVSRTAADIDRAAASWIDDMRAEVQASRDAQRETGFKLVLLRGLIMTGYLREENWRKPAPTPVPQVMPRAIR